MFNIKYFLFFVLLSSQHSLIFCLSLSLGFLFDSGFEGCLSLALYDLNSLRSDSLADLGLPVDVVALSPSSHKVQVVVLLFKDCKVVAPLGDVSLFLSVLASYEVFHELDSVFEGLGAAQEAGVESLVAWEGVGNLSAVTSFVITRMFKLYVGLAHRALYIGIAQIFTSANDGHGNFSIRIFSFLDFQTVS